MATVFEMMKSSAEKAQFKNEAGFLALPSESYQSLIKGLTQRAQLPSSLASLTAKLSAQLTFLDELNKLNKSQVMGFREALETYGNKYLLEAEQASFRLLIETVDANYFVRFIEE